jgi:hypothetical protein
MGALKLLGSWVPRAHPSACEHLRALGAREPEVSWVLVSLHGLSGPRRALGFKYPSFEMSGARRATADFLDGPRYMNILRILQQHLHFLQLADSPTCAQCGKDYKLVAHYLLKCPRYVSHQENEPILPRSLPVQLVG